jgi:hypothetical protein
MTIQTDQLKQASQVIAVTSDRTFENFSSLTLIDAGAADGFQLAGSDDVYCVIPTGIVINLGGSDGRVGAKFSVKAAAGKSLNVTAILYQ